MSQLSCQRLHFLTFLSSYLSRQCSLHSNGPAYGYGQTPSIAEMPCSTWADRLLHFLVRLSEQKYNFPSQSLTHSLTLSPTLYALPVDGTHLHRGPKLVPSVPGIAENTQHAVIAGAIGGYVIWGKYSSVNYQIVLYLTSRIITGMASLAREKKVPPFHWKLCNFDNVYPIKAAVVWGTVMALFETYPHVLHPSLKKSMDDVYRS